MLCLRICVRFQETKGSNIESKDEKTRQKNTALHNNKGQASKSLCYYHPVLFCSAVQKHPSYLPVNRYTLFGRWRAGGFCAKNMTHVALSSRGQRPVCLKWTNAKFCTFNELQREETWCQGLSYPDARVWRRRCLWNARGPPNTASTAGCPPWPSLHRRACSGRSRLHSGTCLDQDPPMCRLVF